MARYINGTVEVCHAPFDGSGNFNRTFPPGGWQGDAAGAIKIRADRHDQHDSDLAAGLSNVICRDGQSQVTANIPMNAKKITNLGTPTAPTDAATKAYVDTAAAASVYAPPIGSGMEYWGPTPPAKWLLAHGQAISRVTYSALFTVMGTAFGNGDGSTTFNMPDVRGRTVAGKDNMGGASAGRMSAGNVLGAAGGTETVALTVAEMPAHTHNTTISVSGTTSGRSAAHTHSVPLYDTANWSANVFAMGRGTGGAVGTGTIPAETTDHTHTYSTSGSGTSDSKGSGTAHSNLQPTIVANYIIYAGV